LAKEISKIVMNYKRNKKMPFGLSEVQK